MISYPLPGPENLGNNTDRKSSPYIEESGTQKFQSGYNVLPQSCVIVHMFMGMCECVCVSVYV